MRDREKGPRRFAADPSLITSQPTRRPPPRRGVLSWLRGWALARRTRRRSEGDSNRWPPREKGTASFETTLIDFQPVFLLEDLAFVVDGTPQIHVLARDPDDHFVEMPAVARSRTAPPQIPSDRRSEFEHPIANALVGDVEPTLDEQLLDIAIA